MILVFISFLMLIGVAVAVRLFDSSIRSSKYGKLIVDIVFIAAILIIIVKFIVFIVGG